ncbi:unnamed protein product [Amoebophrya sp. A120]|nr:unnamed protein product [Amoebophrya sp. A120]|eukprot:GSA120T00018975001.1
MAEFTRFRPQEISLTYWGALMTIWSYVYVFTLALIKEAVWWLQSVLRIEPGYSYRKRRRPGLEAVFIEHGYGSLADCWNRPISSSPAAYVKVVKRERKSQTFFDPLKPLELTGEEVLSTNLASYNYLGFGGVDNFCTEFVANCIAGPCGFSTCAARGGHAGTRRIHLELEAKIADFLGKEDALVYGMGFATNSIHIPALVDPEGNGKGCLILSDILNHRSIVEGVRMSGVTVRPFAHNDMVDLEAKLREACLERQMSQGLTKTEAAKIARTFSTATSSSSSSKSASYSSGSTTPAGVEVTTETKRPWRKIIVIVEGIYSMEGDFCRLRETVALKNKYGAYLYLDEAHSIGAVGKSGRGVSELLNVPTGKIDVLMGTFTKSFGSAGGYIAGDKVVIDSLRKNAASSGFSVSMSPACAAQAYAALHVIQLDPIKGAAKLKSIRENSNYFREELQKMGYCVLGDVDSPVIPVLMDPLGMLELSKRCLDLGVAIVVVGYPATPFLLNRARFCISAAHTRAQLSEVLGILREQGERLGILYCKNQPKSIDWEYYNYIRECKLEVEPFAQKPLFEKLASRDLQLEEEQTSAGAAAPPSAVGIIANAAFTSVCSNVSGVTNAAIKNMITSSTTASSSTVTTRSTTTSRRESKDLTTSTTTEVVQDAELHNVFELHQELSKNDEDLIGRKLASVTSTASKDGASGGAGGTVNKLSSASSSSSTTASTSTSTHVRSVEPSELGDTTVSMGTSEDSSHRSRASCSTSTTTLRRRKGRTKTADEKEKINQEHRSSISTPINEGEGAEIVAGSTSTISISQRQEHQIEEDVTNIDDACSDDEEEHDTRTSSSSEDADQNSRAPSNIELTPEEVEVEAAAGGAHQADVGILSSCCPEEQATDRLARELLDGACCAGNLEDLPEEDECGDHLNAAGSRATSNHEKLETHGGQQLVPGDRREQIGGSSSSSCKSTGTSTSSRRQRASAAVMSSTFTAAVDDSMHDLVNKEAAARLWAGVSRDTIDKRNFCMLDPMGLAINPPPDLPKVCNDYLWENGFGACGPRGFYGGTTEHLLLEQRLADFFQKEEAVLYSHSVTVASSVFASMILAKDRVFCQESVNFGVKAGLRLNRSGFKLKFYKDAEELEHLLKTSEQERIKEQKNMNAGGAGGGDKGKAASTSSTITGHTYVIAEALSHCDGTILDLPALLKLKKRYGVLLALDESLSFGALGPRGIVDYFGVSVAEIDVIMASLEYGIAGIGGFCATSHALIRDLRLTSSGYCFSASAPGVSCKWNLEVLERLGKGAFAQRAQQLRLNADTVRRSLDDAVGDKLAISGASYVIFLREKIETSRKTKINQHSSSGGAVSGNNSLLGLLQKELADRGIVLDLWQRGSVEKALTRRFQLTESETPALRLCISSLHSDKDLQEVVAKTRKAVLKIMPGDQSQGA